MKSRQVGYVLIALILLGVGGLIGRIITDSSNQFVMKGLMPISGDVIDRVQITEGDITSELIKVTDEVWRVGKHDVFSPRMNDFWSHVNDIPQAQLVARKPKHHDLLGVTGKNNITITFFLGPSIQEEFHIGNWSPEVKLCYVRKPGKDETYVIPCERDGVFSANPDTWRDPIVVSIPPQTIESFEFIFPNSKDSYKVLRGSGEDWLVTTRNGDGNDENDGIADTQFMSVLTQTVNIVPALGFEEDSIAKTLDFDAPDGALRINTYKDSGSPTTRIKLIRKDDSTYYAKIPSQSTVYIVDGAMAEFLMSKREMIEIPK